MDDFICESLPKDLPPLKKFYLDSKSYHKLGNVISNLKKGEKVLILH